MRRLLLAATVAAVSLAGGAGIAAPAGATTDRPFNAAFVNARIDIQPVPCGIHTGGTGVVTVDGGFHRANIGDWQVHVLLCESIPTLGSFTATTAIGTTLSGAAAYDPRTLTITLQVSSASREYVGGSLSIVNLGAVTGHLLVGP